MDLILFILLVPVINLIILIIVLISQEGAKGRHSSNGPVIMSPENHSAPENEGYKDTSDLADKFDGRLTNITKNPMKGVL